MANRINESQSLHDRVIDEVVKHLNKTDFDIYTNPGSIKNAKIGDNYPDVIMTDKGTKTVKFIIEVETADTVNQNEAENQWLKYSREISATFYLMIPLNSKSNAQLLCNRFGMNVRYATYQVDKFNNITIHFE
jgi:hypothetical protein